MAIAVQAAGGVLGAFERTLDALQPEFPALRG